MWVELSRHLRYVFVSVFSVDVEVLSNVDRGICKGN